MSEDNKVKNNDTRDTFSSKAGFIIACIGSAVGMGNIWLFPYRLGQFGGAAFLIPYIIFVILLGCTGLMGEFAFGRMTQTGPIGSFKFALETKNKKWGGIFGIIPVVGAFGIAVGYAVVVGWFIKFLLGSITGEMLNATDSAAYFGSIAGPFGSVIWHFIALFITAIVLLLGVSKGIEKVNKFMMPAFYILFLILLIRALMLDGASEGLLYLCIPKWEVLSQPKTWIYALGQAFFSLSLAGSGMIVYGSYLKRDIDILSSAKNTVVFDTLAAITAGLVIIPAVFAFNLDPTAGPPLLFITLPSVFKLMPLGGVFAVVFFISVLFASITSLMNLLEVPIEALQSNFKLERRLSVILVCVAAFLVGLFVENGDILGSWMDFVSIYIIPLGAFISGVMFFWIIGIDKAKAEIETGSKKVLGSWFKPMAKYVFVLLTVTVLIAGILLGGIG